MPLETFLTFTQYILFTFSREA